MTAVLDPFVLEHAPGPTVELDPALLRARAALNDLLARLARVDDAALTYVWTWDGNSVDVRYGVLPGARDDRVRDVTSGARHGRPRLVARRATPSRPRPRRAGKSRGSSRRSPTRTSTRTRAAASGPCARPWPHIIGAPARLRLGQRVLALDARRAAPDGPQSRARRSIRGDAQGRGRGDRHARRRAHQAR